MSALFSIFRRPRLHTEDGTEERHATWLELFFDLVFVVAVAELAHLLHEDISWSGIAIFVALFVPVWWQWIDFSYYADQFDTGDLFSRLVTLLVMFGIIVMAITIHDVTHGGSIYFAAVYAALRLVIVLLYVWAWRTVPQSRELTARYSLSFSIALVIWCISLFTPEPLRFVLWAAALLIEIGNGPLTYATIKHVPQQVSHMDERFGLFVILVLGEAVIAVATGVSGTTWLLPTLLTAVAGFIFAACSWWLYFARADASVINQALRSNRRGLLRSYVYGYSHFFVFVGITAAGVGIQTAIESAPTQALGVVERAVLCGGAATFLLGISVVQWATPQSLSRSSFGARMVGVAACALLILVGDAWSPLALMALVALILAGLVAFDVIYANRSLEQPLEHEQSIESEAV